MSCRHNAALFLWLILGHASVAAPAFAEEVDSRKEKLFSMFVAPCCWRENLRTHHSPKADETRTEIEALIAAGRSDDEIQAALVDRHGLRVLATPPGVRGQWLNWIPRIALASGMVVVGAFIRQSLRRSEQARAEAAPDVFLADIEGA